ncbi:transmembrane protein 223-like [Liolophura sinensis]|uniref:transmembrane protein 223-like n=1 Tax=Liolophura sinensis TaxID=3198878 RepID=UPI003158E33F
MFLTVARYLPKECPNLYLIRHSCGRGSVLPSVENYTLCGKFTTRTTTTFAVRTSFRATSIWLKTFYEHNLLSTAFRFSTRPKDILPFEKEFKITKNVLVYSYDNSRFYKLLSYFGAVQFVFWLYLATFSYSSLRDVPIPGEESPEDVPWWRLVNLGKNKYKNGIALLCFSVGYIVLFISIMYPLRAVNSLWLFKGGKSVGLVTHAPFGKKLTHVTPLENISCVQSRAQAQSQVPLKVKNKWFFYLLDKKGVFHNPGLFDYMVGLRRNLK